MDNMLQAVSGDLPKLQSLELGIVLSDCPFWWQTLPSGLTRLQVHWPQAAHGNTLDVSPAILVHHLNGPGLKLCMAMPLMEAMSLHHLERIDLRLLMGIPLM